MNKFLLKATLPIASMLILTGCIDDNYDLDNIDKTSQIKVNDLVVPVNLSEIWMGDVLDADETDIITTYQGKDGKEYYAITTNGSFNPDPVNIKTLTANTADNVTVSIDNLGATRAAGDISLPEKSAMFTYQSTEVDPSINQVYQMSLAEPMEISLSIESSVSANISNLQISLPTEFEAYFNGQPVENGIITVPNVAIGTTISGITVTSIETSEVEIGPENNGYKEFLYEGFVGIKGGEVEAASLSGSLSYINFQFKLGTLNVNEIVGNITKTIDVPAFDGVDLTDLPDFLRDGNSSLVLANPQLYITVNDPIGANLASTLTITPQKEETELESYAQSFSIAPMGQIGEYTLLLAPSQEDAIYNYFNYEEFKNLSIILKGNGTGLPDRLDLALASVNVTGDCTIPLGVDIEMNGNYEFFAPLDMEGSIVEYVKTETGFFSKETDGLDIDLLKISASASTNVPYNIELSVTPLGRDGKPLNGYVSVPVNLPANANSHNFELVVENATGIDGVTFKAYVVAESGTLSTDQFIKLDNLKAQVTGAYITDFD